MVEQAGQDEAVPEAEQEVKPDHAASEFGCPPRDHFAKTLTKKINDHPYYNHCGSTDWTSPVIPLSFVVRIWSLLGDCPEKIL